MNVLPFKIPKTINENLIVQVDCDDIFYNKLHQHEEIQIAFIKKGQGELIISDDTHPYSAGDIFVIGSNIPHQFDSIKQMGVSSHMISVFFTKRTFGSYFVEIPELETIHQFFHKSESGFKLLPNNNTVRELMLKIPNADKFSRYILFLKIIEKICHCETLNLANFMDSKETSINNGGRMQTVFDYVMNNFHEDITLEQVAELVYMTPNAFCRFFKQRTNKTFFNYLIELRIEHACQLLRNNPDISIAQVSNRCGFNSISNFNRKFKKLKKKTPSNYIYQN